MAVTYRKNVQQHLGVLTDKNFKLEGHIVARGGGIGITNLIFT